MSVMCAFGVGDVVEFVHEARIITGSVTDISKSVSPGGRMIISVESGGDLLLLVPSDIRRRVDKAGAIMGCDNPQKSEGEK